MRALYDAPPYEIEEIGVDYFNVPIFVLEGLLPQELAGLNIQYMDGANDGWMSTPKVTVYLEYVAGALIGQKFPIILDVWTQRTTALAKGSELVPNDAVKFQPADVASLWLFVGFSICMFFVCLEVIRRVSSNLLWFALFIGLVLVFSIAGASGIVATHFLPLGPVLFALVFFFALSFSFGKPGLELARLMPLFLLIGFQGFRLPLELILHHWSSIGTVPQAMTWSGQNWDVVTGIVSICAVPLLKKSRGTAIFVNAVGFLLLMNVLRVVVMSSPLPISWQLENPLLLAAYFPYCLIGPLFVMPALIGHLIVFRKLLSAPN